MWCELAGYVSDLCFLPQDTSKFKFPMVLDMSAYCEEVGHVREDSRYELFSVIIHSGSTHSGHYTAYIRDVDALGCWSYPVSGQNRAGQRREGGVKSLE